MNLAKSETVVLRNADGSVFALTNIDDSELEVELLKNNPEFMALLKQLAQEGPAISLQDLRKELGLMPARKRRRRLSKRKTTG